VKPLRAILLCLLGLICWLSPASAWAEPDGALTEQVLQIIRSHPEVLIETQQVYLQQKQAEAQQQQTQLLQQWQRNPASLISKSPVFQTASAPRSDAVWLAEFSDFQCPYCAKAHEALKQIRSTVPSLHLAYKFLPLTNIHPEALAAAKAAWAAAQQDKFWQYHDALFDRQSELGESLYSEIANQLGLNLSRFNRDRASAEAQQQIDADVALAEQLQVMGTPTFLIKTPKSVGLTDLTGVQKQIKDS
jgi:protein-disulfide isomerase